MEEETSWITDCFDDIGWKFTDTSEFESFSEISDEGDNVNPVISIDFLLPDDLSERILAYLPMQASLDQGMHMIPSSENGTVWSSCALRHLTGLLLLPVGWSASWTMTVEASYLPVTLSLKTGIIGIILLVNLKPTGSIGQTDAVIVVLLVCLFVMCFAWSWGPLGWLIPSETFPLETRTAGFSFAVSANMLFTFIIAQSFLSMLCKMQAGIFFFFAAWILVAGVFALYLMPETKGVPVDDMVERVWKQHWFWKSYITEDDPDEDLKQRKLEMAASTSRS
ncbi:hypothetical protein NE237_011871 [Protea cynaroides]|uniref:Major facilitator superfamily (MFS) profile domain-containing protein n=1 Tax=Protea cynaroides TaxID=273540 RepID=A0A9Q0GYQ9_9MAGN|nr:hypothetical protein NE237_011871 [Protea cynaroides]